MAQSSSAAHQIASRYAAALIDTAQAAKSLDSVEKDINELSAMMTASDDLKKLVSSPAFGAQEQISAIDAITQKASFNKLTSNFLHVLVNNRRLNALDIIITAFRNEIAKRRGDVTAKVRTAVELSSTQQQELQNQLKKAVGANVVLDIKVDPALLGGMVVTVGSRQYDDSVRSKLDALKQTLTSSNQNNILKEVG